MSYRSELMKDVSGSSVYVYARYKWEGGSAHGYSTYD